MTFTEESTVRVQRYGALTRLTLNRPRVINALNDTMFVTLTAALAAAQHDGTRVVVIDGAGERGTCGGGDITAILDDESGEILAREYALNLAISRSSVPVVGVMDGITMGGGVGLTGHAALRIASERSRIAMPEVRIGLIPDVGGHLLLSRMPGRLGELFALTAAEMNGHQAVLFGFADVCVPSDRFVALRDALSTAQDPISAITPFTVAAHTVCSDTTCRAVSTDPGVCLAATAGIPGSSAAVQAWWDPLCDAALRGVDADDVAAVHAGVLRLLRMLEAAAHPWAAPLAAQLRAMCPTSLVATVAQLLRTRQLGLDLAGVLSDDARVLPRLTARADFREGVRAQVIDKDRQPRWRPERLEDVEVCELEALLRIGNEL